MARDKEGNMDKSLNVVVAEDEYLCLVGIRDGLTTLGHRVVGECRNGRDLVETSLRVKPDLIITDINMNELDGLDATAIISREISVPVIIVSGYDDKDLLARAASGGVYSYLLKPIDQNDLRVAIEVTLAKHEEVKRLRSDLLAAQENLENRKFIEKAKGILMDRMKMTEADAMRRLQKLSKDRNQKLVAIAKEVIQSDRLLS